MDNGTVIKSSVSTTYFKYYFIVATLFSATWLISNVAAIKLVSIFGITLTGGFFIFPFTAMLSSIIVEVYGYKNARQAIWAGFILNLLFVVLISIVSIIPSSYQWHNQYEFEIILVPETRIIIASLISFILSDFSNSYLMAKMKIKSNGRSLIKRILISYTLSMSIDVICFMILAFAGAIPILMLFKLITAAYFKKILFQIVLIPLTWYLINNFKKWESIEVYDYDTKFNPFSINNVYEIGAYQNIEKNQSLEEKSVINLSQLSKL